MSRGFDRLESDYAPIAVLLDDRLKDLLDRLIAERVPSGKWEAAVDRDPYLTVEVEPGRHVTTSPGFTLSGSEKARLRLALWFWNSDHVKLRQYDFRVLDPVNRRRLVAALSVFLDLVPTPFPFPRHPAEDRTHDLCEVKGPHGPHQVVLQYIDVGVGGQGIPEYSDCPGLSAPDEAELRAHEDEQAERDGLEGQARAEDEERDRAKAQADEDRAREEADRGDYVHDPEGS